MKASLFLFLMLFSTTLFSQTNIVNMTRWNLDRFSYKCCDDLKIDNAFIYIQEINGLIFNKYTAVSYGKDSIYTIVISDQLFYSSVREVIAHELIHISQLYHKELVIIDSKTIAFRDALYQVNEKTHIDDPQEKDAARLAKVLYEKNK